MPSSISACATGTTSEREASRVVPWCEARSERPPLFRRVWPVFPSSAPNIEGAGGTPPDRRLIVFERPDEGNPAIGKPTDGPATALGMPRLG